MARTIKQEEFFKTLQRCHLDRDRVTRVRQYLVKHDFTVSEAELVLELQKLGVSYAQQLSIFQGLGVPEKAALELLSGVERQQQGIGSTYYRLVITD